MSFSSVYMQDHVEQTCCGPLKLTEEHKSKNLQLYDIIKDILPIDDTYKVSDCDLIYRFLIARHMNVSDSSASLRKYVEMRRKENLNHIIKERYDDEIESNSCVVHGFDKDTCPILWCKPNVPKLTLLLRAGRTNEITRAYLRALEMVRFVAKARNVERCTLVVDLAQVKVSFVNSLTLSFVRELFKILQEYYPEVMSRILIFNAGLVVSGAWKVLKPLVDKRVQEKLRFFSGPPKVDSLMPFVTEDQILPLFGTITTQNIAEEMIQMEANRLSCSDAWHAQTVVVSQRVPAANVESPHVPNSSVVLSEMRRLTTSLELLPFESDAGMLFSIHTPFDSDDMDEVVSTMQIGTLEALEELNKSGGEGRPHTIPREAGREGDGDLLTIDLREDVGGTLVGLCNNETIGEMEGNIMYHCPKGTTTTATTTHLLEQKFQTPPVFNRRVIAGELIEETSHPFYQQFVVCDAQRKPLYLLRKIRLRRQVVVYRVISDPKYFNADMIRPMPHGKKVKLAKCLPHTRATDDPTAWVMETMERNTQCVAEKVGRRVAVWGELTATAPVHLFALLMGICRMWDSGLSAKYEKSGMKLSSFFTVKK